MNQKTPTANGSVSNDTRTVAQIEQDMERHRRELSASVSALASQVSPRAGIESAKAGVRSIVDDASAMALAATDDAAHQLKLLANEASMHVKVLVADVKRGDVKTIALGGLALVATVGLIGYVLKR